MRTRKVKARKSTAEKLWDFRESVRSYYAKVRSPKSNSDPIPKVNQFPSMYHHFAERILDEEKANHERTVKESNAIMK